MLGSDVMRGYNDTIILHLLLQSDSYGYEISKAIEQVSEGHYLMKETTLYSAVNRLEKLGYVASYQGEQTFGRPRTYYTITNSGRKFYREKCAEWNILKRVVDRFTMEETINGTN